MKEKLIQFSREGTLHGTLSIPEDSMEKYPAVLILPGSGPLDRDGNGKQNFNLYNQLANHFTDFGLVTLRYDKRGAGKSEGTFVETGMADLVADGKVALNWLKEQPFVDQGNVLIAGHSEGCMLATSIAAENDLAGVIFISGAAETLREALQYQRQLITEELKNKKGLGGFFIRLFKIPDKVSKQGNQFDEKMLNSSKDVVQHQMIKMPVKWFREHYQSDLHSKLSQINCPILAVTGEKDVQATPEKVFEVTKYVPEDQVEAKIIPNMNHMLREQTEPKSSLKLKKVYKNIGEKKLSPELINTLQDWLNRHV